MRREDHVWCVIMYFSQTHSGPGNTNTTVIKPSRLPNAKTTTYFHKNVKIGIFNFIFVFSQCETVILVAVHVDTNTTTTYANVFPENQVSTKRHHHDQTVSLLYKWKWELCLVISNLNSMELLGQLTTTSASGEIKENFNFADLLPD